MFGLPALVAIVEGWLGPQFAKFAKPLIWIAFALLILAALWGGKCAYDKNVVATHDARQDAASAKADKKADDNAADQRRVDDARLSQEAQQLKGAQNGATSDLDRRLAFQRCLRLQQSARSNGKQPPACNGSGLPAGTASPHG